MYDVIHDSFCVFILFICSSCCCVEEVVFSIVYADVVRRHIGNNNPVSKPASEPSLCREKTASTRTMIHVLSIDRDDGGGGSDDDGVCLHWKWNFRPINSIRSMSRKHGCHSSSSNNNRRWRKANWREGASDAYLCRLCMCGGIRNTMLKKYFIILSHLRHYWVWDAESRPTNDNTYTCVC